jgi:hypothetical protein
LSCCQRPSLSLSSLSLPSPLSPSLTHAQPVVRRRPATSATSASPAARREGRGARGRPRSEGGGDGGGGRGRWAAGGAGAMPRERETLSQFDRTKKEGAPSIPPRAPGFSSPHYVTRPRHTHRAHTHTHTRHSVHAARRLCVGSRLFLCEMVSMAAPPAQLPAPSSAVPAPPTRAVDTDAGQLGGGGDSAVGVPSCLRHRPDPQPPFSSPASRHPLPRRRQPARGRPARRGRPAPSPAARALDAACAGGAGGGAARAGGEGGGG